MVTFDDTMSTAKKCFDTAAAKTGDVVQLSKRYIEKAQVKSRLNSLYERLGKAQYLTQTGLKDESDIIEDLIDKISETREELNKANVRYKEMKSVRCEICGKKNTPKSLYCSRCGEKL